MLSFCTITSASEGRWVANSGVAIVGFVGVEPLNDKGLCASSGFDMGVGGGGDSFASLSEGNTSVSRDVSVCLVCVPTEPIVLSLGSPKLLERSILYA